MELYQDPIVASAFRCDLIVAWYCKIITWSFMWIQSTELYFYRCSGTTPSLNPPLQWLLLVNQDSRRWEWRIIYEICLQGCQGVPPMKRAMNKVHQILIKLNSNQNSMNFQIGLTTECQSIKFGRNKVLEHWSHWRLKVLYKVVLKDKIERESGTQAISKGPWR